MTAEICRLSTAFFCGALFGLALASAGACWAVRSIDRAGAGPRRTDAGPTGPSDQADQADQAVPFDPTDPVKGSRL